MKNEAMFFKDVINFSELEKLTNMQKGMVYPYTIIARISLDKTKYDEFCKNFMKGYNFLYPYIDTLKVSGNIWHCLLIEHEPDVAILTMTNGYQYPRFVAIRSGNI
ncbi:hypothetical protein ACRQU7_08730 [Caproiciproducens sp. R1]|uniref:hypothetical protein n=1 Tax=Caproiciproducens sp. R1 TaxID=3435000 RepID=UPI004033459F